MPTVAWFYGVAIRMYVRDHPPPHFHAIYGEQEALIAIETGKIIEGALPKKAAILLRNGHWHGGCNCVRNWRRARAGEPLEKIAGSDAD